MRRRRGSGRVQRGSGMAAATATLPPRMDYGHDLLFGTFVIPAAERPEHAVELAAVADRSGLDLVTFQDHPYQPGFLDAWTLLSHVGARTSRLRVGRNVLNLPLRQPPAMLARAAASIDLLCGGRFALGIGAGRVLADMALRRGVGTFVLGAEEAATIERFAAEVVPRTRELVAAERHAPATT
jgi:alkanesulfonate monooxygenase SsuD/methylene tetrahydromethanopterin reductase-like flavin-dependent oxidoreductase (luciferase family)